MATSNQFFDAIRAGDAESVRSLLANDPALAGTPGSTGATPVLWAIYCRHPELTDSLPAGRKPDFFEACALGHEERVTELLGHDPGLAASVSGDGFTGLGLAAFFGRAGAARLLLEAGADPDQSARNPLGVAPLHSAVAAGSLEILALLLDRGAKPDAIESSGFTPLASAAGHGSREMVDRLLARGADPRHRTNQGQVAADLARSHGHEELAKHLERLSA
jgi:ankyrin repeat protein